MENKGLCQQVGGVQHQGGGGGGLHVVFLGLFINITTETDIILYIISVGSLFDATYPQNGSKAPPHFTPMEGNGHHSDRVTRGYHLKQPPMEPQH